MKNTLRTIAFLTSLSTCFILESKAIVFDNQDGDLRAFVVSLTLKNSRTEIAKLGPKTIGGRLRQTHQFPACNIYQLLKDEEEKAVRITISSFDVQEDWSVDTTSAIARKNFIKNFTPDELTSTSRSLEVWMASLSVEVTVKNEMNVSSSQFDLLEEKI
jgi:hypothetical protein